VSHAKLQEVASLAGLACHGSLAPEEVAKLDALLAGDAAAQQHYLRQMELDVMLGWHGRTMPSLLLSKQTQPSPILRLLTTARWMANSPTILTLVLAIALYGGFVLLVWNLRPAQQFVANAVPAANDDLQTADQQLAVLTRAENAGWKDQTAGITSPRVLQVRAGVAELRFSQGANVVVEGPAEFEVRSANAGFLRHGKLMARVPQRAIGFTVETATTKVIDLGTEFEVRADKDGTAEVQVFEGKVEFFSRTNGGTSQFGPERVTLAAGAGRRIEASKNRPGFVVSETEVVQRTVGRKTEKLPKLVSNGGFEAPLAGTDTDRDDNDFTAGPPYLWNAIGEAGVFDPGPELISPPQVEGEQVAFLNNAATLYQATKMRLQPNTTYTLNIDVVERSGNKEVAKVRAGMFVGGSPQTGTVLTQTDYSNAPGTWTTITVTYTTDATVPEGEIGVFLQTEATSAQTLIDNASLVIKESNGSP
jgi:hypothetical protein